MKIEESEKIEESNRVYVIKKIEGRKEYERELELGYNDYAAGCMCAYVEYLNKYGYSENENENEW